MKNTKQLLLRALAVAVAASVFSFSVQAEQRFPVNNPELKEGEYVHVPPTMEDLEKSDFHPELKRVIRRGHDLFVNTQQLRDKNVFNNMNCSSCHMGEGRLPFAGPVWPAAVTLADYRGKNDHVNNLEERIVGCFTYSMNGKPPAYGSDDMVALTAYHQWLAKGVPMYQDGNSMHGRGYPKLAEPEQKADYERGAKVFTENCSLCHGDDGAGVVQNDKVVFPPVWGDDSYNWGAGIIRHFTLSSFIKHNMPLGRPNSLTDQEAWDVAYYINTQDRPQEPRFTGDVKETREKYLDSFHKHTSYGLEVNGKLLGEGASMGRKDFLLPDIVQPRTFTAD
ncbi:MAG TPA: c-type cytochrome [Thiopseudomonas sp.]|nr:c-type cytochrome [Thiopseudomonas sp.]